MMIGLVGFNGKQTDYGQKVDIAKNICKNKRKVCLKLSLLLFIVCLMAGCTVENAEDLLLIETTGDIDTLERNPKTEVLGST